MSNALRRGPGGGRGGRRQDFGLPDQLLAVRPREAALRFQGTSVGCLNAFSKHAARRRDGEREGGKEGVRDKKSDEVGSGLRTRKHVRFKRHVQRPKQSEYNVYRHIDVGFLGGNICIRMRRVPGRVVPGARHERNSRRLSADFRTRPSEKPQY